MNVRLREWRERRRLSIRRLAARAGVGFATVFRIETGAISPTVGTLARLAEALDVHITDLFPPKSHKRIRR